MGPQGGEVTPALITGGSLGLGEAPLPGRWAIAGGVGLGSASKPACKRGSCQRAGAGGGGLGEAAVTTLPRRQALLPMQPGSSQPSSTVFPSNRARREPPTAPHAHGLSRGECETETGQLGRWGWGASPTPAPREEGSPVPQQEPGPASHLVTGRTVGRGATLCVPVLTPLSPICSHQILNHPQRLRHHPCLAEARGAWGPGGHGPFRPEALSAPTPQAVGLGPGLPGGVSLPCLLLPGSRVCVAPLSLPLPGWASSPRSQRPGSGTRCWSEPAQAGGRVVWGLSSQQPWQTEA